MYDILIIGGGINGTGIARDAAGRGLKVLLCERGDLACGTSSWSSKLIHGGLRYLESYEFGLVRKALAERETLLRIAPHIVRPMRFVLPVEKGMRPAWMLRIGLFLYDHLAQRKQLKETQTLDLRTTPQGAPLRSSFVKGFEYSDCQVDDARLVVLNAVDAAERGADILTYTACTALERRQEYWTATLSDGRHVEARVVVNAAGPWVDVVRSMAGNAENRLRLVKGSHIVTRQLYRGDHAYIFQSADGRVVFATPFAHGHTLIGTTDIEWRQDADSAAISEEETDYLLTVANHYFRNDVKKGDVVWSYSGVRPLFDDKDVSASNVTRDYAFDLDTAGGAPSLSIFGGKLTTYRVLAEAALSRMSGLFPNLPKPWTADTALPGGDIVTLPDWPWLPKELRDRWAAAYGARGIDIVGQASSINDLGQHFGGGLYEVEVRHLIDREFVRTAEDILWRRSKLGLVLTNAECSTLEEWLKNKPNG